MEETKDMKYEEIDLMDYAAIAIREKKLILKILFVILIVAGILIMILPKVYKVDMSMEIGKGPSASNKEDTLIEEPGQVVEKIKSDVYGVNVREKLGIPENKYPKIKTNNLKGTSLINLAIESENINQSKSVLREIGNLIVAEHQERTSKQKELIEKNIESNEKKIKTIDGDIERINNKIKFVDEEKNNMQSKVDALQKILIYNQDPGTQFALFNTKEALALKKQEIEDLFKEIGGHNLQKEDLNSGINTYKASLDNMKFTRVVKSPNVSDKLVSPRPALYMGIAAVAGIFLGVFAVFLKEWRKEDGSRI